MTESTNRESLLPAEGFRDKTWLVMAQELLDGEPSDIDVATAIIYLQADLGDLPADELADLVESLSEPGPECICPPELLSRGGFKGGCRVHG